MRSIAIKILALGLLSFFSLSIVVTIAQYTSFKTDIGFLSQKQAYISNSVWLTAFYIHVFSCFLCLFAGVTQFSKYLQRKHKDLHRFIGKLYIGNIFFINAPVGLILAVFANGGLVSRCAFVTLDLLWFIFTFIALREIKRKNVMKHRKYMIRSYALTLSAITFRLLKPFWIALTPLTLATIYKIDAWLAFSVNLLVAEIIIYFNYQRRLSLDLNVVGNNSERRNAKHNSNYKERQHLE